MQISRSEFDHAIKLYLRPMIDANAEVCAAPDSYRTDAGGIGPRHFACRTARQDVCAEQLRASAPALSRSRHHFARCTIAIRSKTWPRVIETGHPTMPVFQLDPDQIHDLLSYLRTLD
jgi:hypothetical protein